MGMEEQDDAPVTKNDVRGLERKIDEARRGLAAALLRSDARSERRDEALDAKLAAVESRLLSGIDAFVSRTEKVDRAQVIVDWRLTELERRMAAIEPRPS